MKQRQRGFEEFLVSVASAFFDCISTTSRCGPTIASERLLETYGHSSGGFYCVPSLRGFHHPSPKSE